jgi:hypothetical protein
MDISYNPTDLQNFLDIYKSYNFGEFFGMDLVIGFKSKTFGEKMKGVPSDCENVPVEHSFIVKRKNQTEIFSRYFHRKFEIGNVFFTTVENIESDIKRFLDDGFLMMNENDFHMMRTHVLTKVIDDYLCDRRSFIGIL